MMGQPKIYVILHFQRAYLKSIRSGAVFIFCSHSRTFMQKTCLHVNITYQV